jgi:hypothetical protein
MFSKKIIYGCEGRGDADKPYLTRYTVFESKPFQIALHVFHRSDADALHDHPWNFLSIILWRGYNEVTRTAPHCPDCKSKMVYMAGINQYYCPEFEFCNFHCYLPAVRIKSRKYPGMFLFRKATHSHRVELVNNKKAVTLVFMGKRWREWGFFTSKGWQQWQRYFFDNRC